MPIFSIFRRAVSAHKYVGCVFRAEAAEFFFQKGKDRVSITRTLGELHTLTREQEGERKQVIVKMVPQAMGKHKSATGQVMLEPGYKVPMIELQRAERELIANGNRVHRMSYRFVNNLRNRL